MKNRSKKYAEAIGLKDTTEINMARRTTLGAFCALGATAMMPMRVSAAERIKIGYLPVNAMTSIYTEAAGSWNNEKYSAELVRLRGGPAIVQGIQGGSLQAGECAVTVLMSLASQGIPIICLASCNNATTEAPYNRIMVAKDSPLKSVSELKGKTIGILALGTLDHVQLLAALKKAGIGLNEVKIVSIPVPNQPQALASGQVDAMVMPPPADIISIQQNGARMLADATDALPYYPLEVLLASETWANENPDAARLLVAAWLKTNRWIEAHPDKARSVARDFLGLPEEISTQVRMPRWAKNALPVMPGVWNLYYAMSNNGLIKPVDDPQAMMIRYFIEPARKYVLPALESLGMVEDEATDSLNKIALSFLPKGPEQYVTSWSKS